MKKESIQFQDGESIEFPSVEEKVVSEGIIMPENLFGEDGLVIFKKKKAKAKKSTTKKVAKKDDAK